MVCYLLMTAFNVFFLSLLWLFTKRFVRCEPPCGVLQVTWLKTCVLLLNTKSFFRLPLASFAIFAFMLILNLILISELLAISFRMLLTAHVPTPFHRQRHGVTRYSQKVTHSSSIIDDRNTEKKDMDLCTKLFTQTKVSFLTPVCFM